MALSLLVFFTAGKAVLNTYYWGYALLPGTLFIFLSGIYLSNIHREKESQNSKLWLSFTITVLVASLVYFAANHLLMRQHTLEIIIGYFIGLAAIHTLGQVNQRSRIDNYLGKLSYPLFLSNYLGILIYDKWFETQPTMDIYSVVIYKLLLILPVSMAVYHLFENPAQKFRKRVQNSSIPRLNMIRLLVRSARGPNT